MESKRQSKISRLIQKDLGDIFQKEYSNYFGPVLVSVTKVRVTPDLSLAKVYVSIYGKADKKATVAMINKQSWEIRKKFGIRAKNQLKNIPDFEFFLDDSLDYIENIENLLNNPL